VTLSIKKDIRFQLVRGKKLVFLRYLWINLQAYTKLVLHIEIVP